MRGFLSKTISILLVLTFLSSAFVADILPSSAVSILNESSGYDSGVHENNIKSPSWNDDETLKILTIGNSFSDDSMEYVADIALSLGVKNVKLGNLYIGGCSLSKHAENARNDAGAYKYRRNDGSGWSTVDNAKISDAVKEENWDYISLQQNSGNSGLASTYAEPLSYLIEYLNGIKSANTVLVWNMTWAYQSDSTHSDFANYGNDQTAMYNAIINAVQTEVLSFEDIALVIPTGTAIQNARTSLLGDTLTRDGYHLSYGLGRYIAGLTFVHKLTGLAVSGISFVPDGVDETCRGIAAESAENAVISPYAVTESRYHDIDYSDYDILCPDLTPFSYWNSNDPDKYDTLIDDTTTALKYYATKRFTKDEIPVGSVIEIQEGYQYRPEGWKDDAVQNSRPGVVSTRRVVVDENWWGDYIYRAFNVSAVGTPSLAGNTGILSALKIYIPKSDPVRLTLSVLGDSISTFAGYIPTADGYNLEHLARYPQDDLLTDVNETWWMQLIAELGARLGINDSWRGATASGAHPVTTGATGEAAAMFNLQRIKNLGANGTPDMIVFYGGTNDYAHVAKLGSFDADSAPASPDFSAVKYDNLADGYVETLLRLRYYYPGALLVAVLPGVTASYYSNDKLAEGNALLKRICEHYGVPYVDLYESGLTVGMLPDGIHPDAIGMDVITDALLDLIGTIPVTPGENAVYPVSHTLTNAKASLSYYKGVTEGAAFTETVTGKDINVTVLMGGIDITSDCYTDGVINIPAVTGELQITVTGTNDILAGHLSALQTNICAGVNLWSVLPHDPQYYSPNQGWGYTTVAAPSVTFEILPGEKIYASSFGKIGENGSNKHSGIRVTFFDDDGVLVSLDPSQVYSEFEQNGFITAPDGAKYVNVPMWGDSDSWELYLVGREHHFENGSYGVCLICGQKIKNLVALYGKTVSILGASISTYQNVSNGSSADTSNSTIRNNVKYYPNSTIPEVTLSDTWWMQVVNDLGLRLLVNNSWSGSSLLHTRNGTVGAYVDRCVQLHDDTGDNAGEEPDIICIQLGTNDFQYYKDTLGTADIDYDALIVDNGDGTYTYGDPSTSLEAAAIVLHKIRIRYPEAEVYYLNLSHRVDGTDDLVGPFNTELSLVCEHFGVPVADIFGSEITVADFSKYIGDNRVHPNRFGMDAYAEAVKTAILENTLYNRSEVFAASFELDNVSSDYGTDNRIMIRGSEFHVSLTYPESMILTVRVTMNGDDITDSCMNGNEIVIPSVEGDVLIAAEAHRPTVGGTAYKWIASDGALISCDSALYRKNEPTLIGGSVSDGGFDGAWYGLDEPVTLLYDKEWSVEICAEGNWYGMILSSSSDGKSGDPYIFKSISDIGIVGFGEFSNGQYRNYGVALDGLMDYDGLHVYRIDNRINEDGTNTAYLTVDGAEFGALDNYFYGTSDQNKKVNPIDGKDLTLKYIGTSNHAVYGKIKSLVVYLSKIEPDENGCIHAVPDSAGAENAVARARLLTDVKWSPAADMPGLKKENGKYLYNEFKAGETYTGVPYSGVISSYTYLGQNVSLESFLTALLNDNSVLYTKNLYSESNPKAASYFGTTCSKLAQYALDIPGAFSTSSIPDIPGMTTVAMPGGYTAEMIRLGDVIVDTSKHTALCTDILFNPDGSVAFIEISEAVVPTARRLLWSVDGFFTHFANYRLCRYSCIDSVPAADAAVVSDGYALMTRYGDRYNYPVSTSKGKIDILDKSYDKAVILRDGLIIDEITLDGTVSVITFDRSVPGYIEAYLEKSNGTRSGSVYACVVTASVSVTDSTRFLGGRLCVECSGSSGAPYYIQVGGGQSVFRALEGKTSAELRFNPSAVSDHSVRAAFKNEYGVYFSERCNFEVDMNSGTGANPSTDPLLSQGVYWEGYNVTPSSPDPVIQSGKEGYWSYTYVPVKADTLYYSNGATRLWFFDGDKNPISTVNAYKDGEIPFAFTTPANTAYISVAYSPNLVAPGAERLTDVLSADPEVTVTMLYDDRYDVSGKEVSIIDAGTPTSYKVGYGVAENTPDEAVVRLENGRLIACGIGEATVMIDGIIYTVKVTSAPISLLLLIGQSNMRGSEGNADQSIICPEGRVYATYGDDRGASNTEFTVSTARYFAPSALAGEYSTVNVEGTTECLSGYPLYTLCEEGAGKIGPDSGFAYEWVKATGEKVWVVNAAHGGTSINAWQKGGKEYNEALLLFTACRQTLQKELAAGHYTLSHTGYFWCQGCSDATQTAEWYINKFTAMHENLKADNTFDHDLDPSTPDITFEFSGIIPILHGLNSYRAGVYNDPLIGTHYESCRTLTFNGPRAAQYIMCSDPGLPDVYMVCDIGAGWMRMPDGSNGVAAYFASHYENGTVDYQTQVPQSASWYKPTTPAAVHDTIHYNQIGYNEVGIESARNMLILLGILPDNTEETTVKFVNWTGYETVTEINARKSASSETLIVPIVSPCYRSKQVTYTVSEGLNYSYYDLTAVSSDVTGTLAAHGAEGSVSVVPREYNTYRFENAKDGFVSVGEAENNTALLSGSIDSGVFNNARIALSDTLMLDHDQSWIIEIKMTGPWYSDEMPKLKKLLSADGAASSVGAYSLMVSGNTDRIWMGYYNGTTHVGCGVCLAEYGISLSDTHIYRLYNQINEDGTNQILLYVDGQYVAPLTRYITGADGDTGTESQMLCGVDLHFGYLGAVSYPLDNGSVEYMHIIESGADDGVHIHSFTPWTAVALPSAEGSGTEYRECELCGTVQMREVDGVWQKYDFSAHLQNMPAYCLDTNLWAVLEHDNYYFASGKNWGVHSSGNVYSVTIPVKPGDMIYASSFGKAGENGHASSNGIRTTFFDIYGILKTYEPSQVYAEFNANGGYIIAPEGSAFINIAMWTNADDWEIYILNAPHIYEDTVVPPTYARGGYTTHTCVCCGDSYFDTYTDKLVHDAFEDGEFKLLLIGNSYSEDASNCGQGMKDSQLLNILQSMLGEDVNITIGLCYSGGKSMAWHATQAERGARSYSLRVISTDQPAWRSLGSVTSAQALEYTDWDVVTLQPYSTEAFSGTANPIYPDGEDEKFYPMAVSNPYMLDHVAAHAPQADVYCYMHWAATSSTSINAGLSYYNTQANFFPTVLTYEGSASGRRYEDIIPVSLSVQNARTTYLAKLRYNTTAYADGNLNLNTDAQIGLQRDGGHLSFNIGRYIAALTFAEIIIPVNIRVDGYSLPDIRITESVGKLPGEYSVIARLSVSAAIDSWKNKNDLTDVTTIDGYQTDPIELAANYDNTSYEIKCASGEDEAKAMIAEAVNAVLPDEYCVHEITLPEDAQPAFGGSFECEVSIRFGYSFKTVSVTVGVTQHDYKDTVTPPTCTEQGYTTHTCAGCGDTFTDSYTLIDPDAHSWDGGVITVEPTEISDGEAVYTCLHDPSHTKTGVVPAIGLVHETRDTLSDGEKITLLSSNAIKNHKHLYLSFDAETLGDGIIRFGHGKTAYSSEYIELRADGYSLCTYANSLSSTSYSHGLQISGRVTVRIDVGTGTAKLTITTDSGTFSRNHNWQSGCNGEVFVEAENCTVSSIDARWWCTDYQSDIWFFGDSWFSFPSSARWPTYFLNDGYTEYLLAGYGGMGAAAGLSNFRQALQFGKPGHAVWCLGMNNSDGRWDNGGGTAVNASWMASVNAFIQLCDENGIEPIFTIIPTSPAYDHRFKNEWIRNSGYRYADFERVLVADRGTWEWYSGYMADVGGHTQTPGAVAVYIELMETIPELYKYTDEEHVHKLYRADAKNAHCYIDGSEEYYFCTLCGAHFTDAEATQPVTREELTIPAAGHSFGEWQQVTAPTSASEGKEIRYCEICGESETRAIPKIEVIDIILFAGQSNMCGWAMDTDAGFDTFTETVTVDKAFTFNNGKGTELLQITEPISANGTSRYGMVPSFLNAYYDETGRRVCACFESHGGVNIDKFTKYTLDGVTGEYTNTINSYYSRMVKSVENARSSLEALGYEVGGIYLVWCQGENEAYYLGTAVGGHTSEYQSTLKASQQKIDYYIKHFNYLIDTLKGDMGLDKAFIIRIGHRKNDTNINTPIITAQNIIGQTNGDAVVVTTFLAGATAYKRDDGTIVNLMRDAPHYLPEGYYLAGHDAGHNAGAYVNSGYTVKPTLYEYDVKAAEPYIYDPYAPACLHTYTSEVTEPTCTEQGYTTFTCTACGLTYTAFYVDALGHDYVSTVTGPTCTEAGFTTHVCSRCGDTYVDAHTDASGHTVVTDRKIMPTNANAGLTEGSHCSVCGEVFEAQQSIPAKGFEWMVEDGAFKVMFIGGSYSEDATNSGQGMTMSRLLDALQALLGDDVEITVGLCYAGGKSIAWHATQAERDTKIYPLRIITTGGTWHNVGTYTSAEALAWTDWDAVVLQPSQAEARAGVDSNRNGDSEDEKFYDYDASVPYMLDHISGHAPQAEIYYYELWATDKTTALNTSLSNYDKIASVTLEALAYIGTENAYVFSDAVPVGAAIQTARSTYLALLTYNQDEAISLQTDPQFGLQRDVSHLSFNIGRYIAAMTFAETLIPDELRVDGYSLPSTRITESIGALPRQYNELALEAVNRAVGRWHGAEQTLTVLPIEGYETDPTPGTAEALSGYTYTVCRAGSDEKLIQMISEAVSVKLPEDYAVTGVEIEYSPVPEADPQYKVTIRYGYTFAAFYASVVFRDHTYDSAVTLPTCTEQGYTAYICTECGYTFTDSYTGPLGHDYVSTVTEPSCTEAGYTTHVCSRCEDTYVDEHTDALGHTWGKWYINVLPSAGTPGDKVRVCAECGEEEHELLSVDAYHGKVISILGASTSTFDGYVPIDDGFNLKHLSRYPQDNLLTDVNETWWMQLISQLDGKLGINDSWRGTTMTGTTLPSAGENGEKCALSNMTRIMNLRSNGEPDLIILDGARNDIANTPNIGVFDPQNAPTEADLVTQKWDNIADAFVQTLLRLRYVYPNTPVLVILGNYSGYYSDNRLDQVNEMMISVCKYYGFHYTDLRESGITADDLPDNIHPNEIGMDKITNCILRTLAENVIVEPGENVVFPVTHDLRGVKGTLGHYRGISENMPFEEELSGEDIKVTVTMGGLDVTELYYNDSKISIPVVTGALVISAVGKYDFEQHLSELPDDICAGINIWEYVYHDPVYYTYNGWGTSANTEVRSATFRINGGERIYSDSFRKAGENGFSQNAVRITYFDRYGVISTIDRDTVYSEFAEYGYVTAPEEAEYINIPMASDSNMYRILLLDRAHDYNLTIKNPTCTEAGYTTHVCSRCEDTYVDEHTDALGHDLIRHDGKPASCTEHGWSDYDTCSRCDFSTYEEIPPTGHSYEGPVFVWSEDHTSARAVFRCKNCSDEAAADAAVISQTMITGGIRNVTVYTASAEFEGRTYTDTFEKLNFIYGDCNGDGKVDGKDLIRLRRYLATYDDDTGSSPTEMFAGADINGDGKINGVDMIRLRKYLTQNSPENAAVIKITAILPAAIMPKKEP